MWRILWFWSQKDLTLNVSFAFLVAMRLGQPTFNNSHTFCWGNESNRRLKNVVLAYKMSSTWQPLHELLLHSLSTPYPPTTHAEVLGIQKWYDNSHQTVGFHRANVVSYSLLFLQSLAWCLGYYISNKCLLNEYTMFIHKNSQSILVINRYSFKNIEILH